MSDLYIDDAMLQRVKSNFGNITDLLRGPGRAMKDLDGSEVGQSDLESRVNDFGGEWDYGIEQLGEFSDSVVGIITTGTPVVLAGGGIENDPAVVELMSRTQPA